MIGAMFEGLFSLFFHSEKTKNKIKSYTINEG